MESWTTAQERFVDDPGAAPTAADPYLLGRGLGPKQHR